MKIGYSFWGYLGDIKYDKFGDIASTPDGNAFYSWSIINKLQEDGHEVYGLMPDRDGVVNTEHLFDSWCREPRLRAYKNMKNIWSKQEYENIHSMNISEMQQHIYDALNNLDIDIVLHEWRMPIPGRNIDVENVEDYQPDLDIQNHILNYFGKHSEKKLIIFDLDYKLDVSVFDNLPNYGKNIYVFELGYKLSNKFEDAIHVEIPFDFRYINEFNPLDLHPHDNLVYVGNRYERDWCIDKYIPTEINGVTVYGNWVESNRDSKEKWPKIRFGKRIQTAEMRNAYGHSKATILLAKKEYLENSFMTARVLEAIFYGCVPLFIEEYGKETIEKYAGEFAPFLTVKNKADVINCVYALKDEKSRAKVIKYLRKHLEFMDVSNFVKKIYEVYEL